MPPSRPRPGLGRNVRTPAGAAALGGVAALVAATFSPLIAIKVGTATSLANIDTQLSGWERHGAELLALAGAGALMTVGALRGARPAMAAVIACGLAALALGLLTDLPHLHDTGLVGELYADAIAGPRAGFYLELAGGALLTVAGSALMAARRGTKRAHQRHHVADQEPAANIPR